MKEVKVIWKHRKGASRVETLVCKKQAAVSFVGQATTRRRVAAFA